MKINRVTPKALTFTRLLDSIHHAPKELFVRGTLPENRPPTVAIVGTRRPTRYGKEVASILARDLAKRGVVIVSGLALGIDAIAHRGALDAHGVTIAVLASGIDDITPRTNRALGEAIIEQGGAVVSEYEPGTPAFTSQFLARNRIVSGLSDAVIIVEAAARSGTLATATFALEQGRDVFVVPGNITSPLSAGCNQLLKQGATPVTCADDILEVIAPEQLTAQASLPLGGSPIETTILQHLAGGLRDGDEILQLMPDITAQDFSQALTMLEINGSIHALGGNQWTIT